MTATTEVDAVVKGTKTLVGLAPRWSRGLWVTRGWFGKRMTKVSQLFESI